MTQFTLFNPYPETPGYRDTDTSFDAAQSINAHTLREMAMVTLTERSSTADECAEANGVPILAMRPRLSELKKQGKVKDTGIRRKNVSGKKAIVWGLV